MSSTDLTHMDYEAAYAREWNARVPRNGKLPGTKNSDVAADKLRRHEVDRQAILAILEESGCRLSVAHIADDLMRSHYFTRSRLKELEEDGKVNVQKHKWANMWGLAQ